MKNVVVACVIAAVGMLGAIKAEALTFDDFGPDPFLDASGPIDAVLGSSGTSEIQTGPQSAGSVEVTINVTTPGTLMIGGLISNTVFEGPFVGVSVDGGSTFTQINDPTETFDSFARDIELLSGGSVVVRAAIEEDVDNVIAGGFFLLQYEVTSVPVPPAALLLLSAIGALALRKRGVAA